VEIRTLLGTILGGLGLYDRAIDELEAVIKLDPKYIRAYVTLAICFTEKGDQDAAVRYATKSNALDKNNGEGD
jgi:Tfp pilus assembly protein PilF